MNDRISELREEIRGRMHDSGIKKTNTEAMDHVLNSAARELAEHEKLAGTDSLTGLRNRRSMGVEIDREIIEHQRTKRPLAAIMLDVDNFKEINDRYGHTAGDQVLVDVARTLKTRTRGMDLVGRYGGDELLIIMPEADGLEAQATAERIRDGIATTPIDHDGEKIKITATLGVTQFTKDDLKKERFITRADQALYKGKHEGRNKVVLF